MYTCAAVFYENKIQNTKETERKNDEQAKEKENKASNCEKKWRKKPRK